MAYVIGGILVVIALIILGLILRKKIYDEVDRHESWKMDIMNRNVTTELSKVKSLNLSGETQEKFESWKDRWDHILTIELPDIEEYLLDAEEAADRFRISGAKKTIRNVADTLQAIEQDIDRMFEELEELLDSEKNSRREIEELQPQIKNLRKKLIQNRHQFGKAEIRFEVEIDELEDQLNNYFDLTNSGNYFEAQQLVTNLKSDLEFLTQQMDEFPITYKKCKNEMPMQIEDLLSGIRTMKEDGYRIEHFGFEKELYKYQERLLESVTILEKGNLGNAYEIVLPIEERITEMYQLLEKEARAKSYIENEMPHYKKLLSEFVTDFDETSKEVKQLQETYFLENSDIEIKSHLESWIKQLKKQFVQIENDVNKDQVNLAEIRGLLEASFDELDELQKSHEEFKERIHTLRKDEIEAKEKVSEMRKQLFDTNRKLQKSNIPGVPSYIWDVLQQATEKSSLVVDYLERQPLDMGKVQNALEEAEINVQSMIEQTEVVLENAKLVELVIQYANRYRSQNAILAARLSEAERMFRNYEYENALEEATQAVEEVEPGAIKRLEELRLVPS